MKWLAYYFFTNSKSSITFFFTHKHQYHVTKCILKHQHSCLKGACRAIESETKITVGQYQKWDFQLGPLSSWRVQAISELWPYTHSAEILKIPTGPKISLCLRHQWTGHYCIAQKFTFPRQRYDFTAGTELFMTDMNIGRVSEGSRYIISLPDKVC